MIRWMEAPPCETKLLAESHWGLPSSSKEKAMFYRNTNHTTQINTRIVTLAAGLALGAVAVVGGSDLLKESSKSNSSTSPVTPRVERISPRFGTAADAVYASQGLQPATQFGTAADAAYAAESIRPQSDSVDLDAGTYLGIGQPPVGQSFGTSADAAYAAMGLAYIRPQTEPVEVDAGAYLGIGQPAIGQSFGTTSDAVYAAMGLAYIRPQTEPVQVDAGAYLGIGQPQVGQSFATTADAVYAAEALFPQREVASVTASPNAGDFLGIGQPGEAGTGPQFGTLADADNASR
jgi:hypothetical protein